MSKITVDSIREDLAQNGWELISENYENMDSEMIYICSEGHKVYAPWKKIRNKFECPICAQNHLKVQSVKVQPKKRGSIRVLGLDQATKVSGYSIIEDGKLIKYGTFRTDLKDEVARYNAVKMWLISLVKEWEIDFIGMEGVQLQNNVETFMILSRLQGVLMECCFENSFPYIICHTQLWRSFNKVKGQSRADKKKSMQLIIKDKYDISVTNDEADSAGIALYTWDQYNKMNEEESWE